MAELKVHKELAARLLAAAKKSDPVKEWPITTAQLSMQCSILWKC